MSQRSILTALLATSLLTAPAFADLKAYVEKADDSYKYEVHSTEDLGLAKVYITKMTSQTWKGKAWSHWLSVIVPVNVKHPDKAILYIMGGTNRDGAPSADSRTARALVAMAARSGAILAVLQQVPNQPLFGDLYEDAAIAHTFDQFIRTGKTDWPLLLPMVKSAVRAMDTVQTVAKEKVKQDVKGFIVLGASKRGWTTYLTAAADQRVKAIAPMVIDVLNFSPQMTHQIQTYGDLSEKIGDYEALNLPKALKTPEGKKLAALVDPWSYRKMLTVPKLLLLGTNDPYWTVDAANIYFPHLPGPKALYYQPNAGHGLSAGIYPTLLAFFDHALADRKLPAMKWTNGERKLSVQWDAVDAEALLWQAHSDTRDFRKARWTSKPLEGDKGVEVQLTEPKEGWTASFVEVRFPHSGQSFGLSTQITVLPKRFPHAVEAE